MILKHAAFQTEEPQQDMKLYLLIYELKGMIKSLSDFAAQDDSLNHFLIDSLEDKMREITIRIEEKDALE